jgi:phosphoglycerate kinase
MIAVTDVLAWCQHLLDSRQVPSLEECLEVIPPLDALDDLPPGTRVQVRCDTNVVVAADGRVADDARLVSLLETLRWGQDHGWVQVIHGHAGADGRPSLAPIAVHLGRLLGTEIVFLDDWMDDVSGAVRPATVAAVAGLPAGTVAMLENARRYALERCLWRARPEDLPALAGRLTCYLRGLRALAHVHVNEAFAASNRDLSSALAPLAMDRVALGRHVWRELRGPVLAARQAQLVVFSGAKLNKLDDLEAVIRRRQVRLLVGGGLLALPLLAAEAQLGGRTFALGRHREEVRADHIATSRRLLEDAHRQGIEVLLPMDFVLDDGSVADTIPAAGAQRDVGPRTLERFAARLQAFARQPPARPAIAFHNGVLGMFEDPHFAEGTRRFFALLHQLHDAGVQVTVGGGEGGTALQQLGDPRRVRHCFTAGTTILKALGTEPIPYLLALFLASRRRREVTPS